MKKLILILGLLLSSFSFSQTFPVNNLVVNGTAQFSGVSSFAVGPTMPTAGAGTSTTQGATTAFVTSAVSSGLSGTAPIVSPAFTGQVSMTRPPAIPNTCSNILAYGGNAGGSIDNTAAFAAALAASVTSQPCVYFPPGVFSFSGQVNLTLPNSIASVTVYGAGSDVSILKWTTGNGLVVNFYSPSNSAHIRDLTFETGAAGTGNGLTMEQFATVPNPANTALSDITGVTLRGADGYSLTDYWNIGINIVGASNIDFTGISAVGDAGNLGTGVSLGGSSTIIPVEYNFQSSSFYGLNIGINYGNYVQGVTVNQSNFTGLNYGIYSAAGLVNLAQLAVVGSQFNCFSNGIFMGSNPAPGILIEGNLFLVPNSAIGLVLNSAGLYSIIGNSFYPANTSPTGTTGIDIVSSTAIGVISGNTLYEMTSNGIVLEAGSHNVNVQSNSYSNNGTNVINNGSSNTVGGGSQ